ncbi:uncharacterized protein LOC131308131 [Rhododendron vialii]|uniref:uncharacterized protein LOC131308131 n=1 Tax=Rhododendron vialii TaxID=182163 RepID=UPI00265FD965|nr:uncharacterized protein LOC131308131 [Rhododendron vialii]
MLPIKDSDDFLEDIRVESGESSVPSSNKPNEVKQAVYSLESNNPSIVTGQLPKLADLVPKEMTYEPCCCVGDQRTTYLILSSKSPDHMCSWKHGNSKIPPTSIFIREDFKDFSSTSINFIIPEKFNFGNGMTLLLSFLPPMKKIQQLPYADLDMKIRFQLKSLWTTILQHFKTRGRVFSNKGRKMRSMINAMGSLVVSKGSMIWDDEEPTWYIDRACIIKGFDFSFREV